MYGRFTKIDVFSHLMTPEYTKRFAEINPKIKKRVEYYTPAVVDLQVRENLMRRWPDVLEIITTANIPLEKWCPPEKAAELARINNDEMAELVLKRPDLFYGAVATLPLHDIDLALKELDYAINDLHLLGIQVQTRIGDDWLADEKYRPILARMAELDKPIWIHPDTNDKLDQDIGIFSWPFETAHCMMHLVTSGIFNEFPNIKFITHHSGALVPFFKERVKYVMSLIPQPFNGADEHFKKFYVDTAVYGNTDALMCAYNYYGPDHMFFGTDAPLGPRWGMVEDTIASIDRMDIPDADKEKILKYNAVDFFKNVI